MVREGSIHGRNKYQTEMGEREEARQHKGSQQKSGTKKPWAQEDRDEHDGIAQVYNLNLQ
jgi:hypothetical protein